MSSLRWRPCRKPWSCTAIRRSSIRRPPASCRSSSSISSSRFLDAICGRCSAPRRAWGWRASTWAVTARAQATRIPRYGFSGQVRVLIDGINVTEGNGGSGFYFDYSSLEEVFIGVQGQSAEMPNPGVQIQFMGSPAAISSVASTTLDFNNNALQGSNIPDLHVIAAFGTSSSGNTATRWSGTTTPRSAPAANQEGQAVVVCQLSQAVQIAVAQPQFQFDKTSDLSCGIQWQGHVADQSRSTNSSATTNGGRRIQPNRLTLATYTYPTHRRDVCPGFREPGSTKPNGSGR